MNYHTTHRGTLLAGLLTLIVVFQPFMRAHAQSRGHERCSDATLSGSYGFNTLNGFFRPDLHNQHYIPDLAAGLVTFDGKGGFTGKLTDVTNGDTGPEAPPFKTPLVGTYVLDADCTGSVTELNTGSHFEIVAVRGGHEVEAIQTDLQETRTLTLKKIESGDQDEENTR